MVACIDEAFAAATQQPPTALAASKEFFLYLFLNIFLSFPHDVEDKIYISFRPCIQRYILFPMNNTAPGDGTFTTGWNASPNARGTADILLSCLFTILLCCWTTVCPNIPALSESRWDQFRDKFDLACIGLLGPEFLLGIAVGQRCSARRSVNVSDECTFVCRFDSNKVLEIQRSSALGLEFDSRVFRGQ